MGAPTVHLLSKEGAGTAAPVVAALVDRILEVAELAAQARGGRLDPPLVAVLDEAANICPIQALPQLYSHFGSRGIQVLTMLQSYQQGVGVWGTQGMDALWSAATVKLVGAGVDDHPFLQKLSGLIGDHDVEKISTSHGRGRGGSRQYSTTREPVLPASTLRALPKTHAVLLATGRRAGLGELLPWYREPDHTTGLTAADITTSAAAALDELRRAAVTALGPTNPVAAALRDEQPEEEVGDAPPRRPPTSSPAQPRHVAAARPEPPAPPTGLVQIDPRLLAELQARLTALEAWRAHQSDLLDELLNPTNPAATGTDRRRTAADPRHRPRGTAVPAGLGRGRTLLPGRGRSTATP